MHLPRRVALILALSSLALIGCKQDIGERCEQNGDCASGLCGNGAGMTSAMGMMCQEAPTAAPLVDAAPNDAARDAGDAAIEVRDAADASVEVSSPDGADARAGDASAETGDAETSGAETPAADGATDVSETGAGG
jgi:hypothetical protein